MHFWCCGEIKKNKHRNATFTDVRLALPERLLQTVRQRKKVVYIENTTVWQLGHSQLLSYYYVENVKINSEQSVKCNNK